LLQSPQLNVAIFGADENQRLIQWSTLEGQYSIESYFERRCDTRDRLARLVRHINYSVQLVKFIAKPMQRDVQMILRAELSVQLALLTQPDSEFVNAVRGTSIWKDCQKQTAPSGTWLDLRE
jgi:Ni,Fe-hydrogenase III large subunit